MKTKENYESYQKLYIKQTDDIKKLEDLLEENKKKITQCDTGYNDSLKKADEVQAEKYFDEKIKLQEEQKKLVNKIKIKRDMAKVVLKEKKFDVLKKAKNLQFLYSDEVKNVRSKLEKAIKEYNSVIDEIDQINDAFAEEEYAYRVLYDSLSEEERREFKQHGGSITDYSKLSVVSRTLYEKQNNGKFIMPEGN